MKKYAIVMLLAVAVGMTACGNGSSEAEAPKADSTQVDSTVVAADTTTCCADSASAK